MKILLLRNTEIGSRCIGKDNVVDVSEDVASGLMKKGFAKPYSGKDDGIPVQEKLDPGTTPKPGMAGGRYRRASAGR